MSKKYKENNMVLHYDITEEIIKGEVNDTWTGMLEYKNRYGVDYNYYVDEDGVEQSAFYIAYGSRDCWETDTLDWKEYNIDFSDPEWKDKWFDAAIDYLMERIEEEKAYRKKARIKTA